MTPLTTPNTSLTPLGSWMPICCSPLATCPSPEDNSLNFPNASFAPSPLPLSLSLSSLTSPVSAFSFNPTPPASSICLFSSSRNDWMAVWSMPSGDSSFSFRACAVFSRSAPASPRSIISCNRVLTVVASFIFSVMLLYSSLPRSASFSMPLMLPM